MSLFKLANHKNILFFILTICMTPASITFCHHFPPLISRYSHPMSTTHGFSRSNENIYLHRVIINDNGLTEHTQWDVVYKAHLLPLYIYIYVYILYVFKSVVLLCGSSQIRHISPIIQSAFATWFPQRPLYIYIYEGPNNPTPNK